MPLKKGEFESLMQAIKEHGDNMNRRFDALERRFDTFELALINRKLDILLDDVAQIKQNGGP